MSPELERLLAALYEHSTCEPDDLPKWEATVARLVADTLQKKPGVTRDQLIEAGRSLPPVLPDAEETADIATLGVKSFKD
jgi:hypothetical protein